MSNESLTTGRRLAGYNMGTRKENDFYPTPDYAIDTILDRVNFDGVVWEPSCGNGAISNKLIQRGYDVKSTDLHDYGYGVSGVDFMECQQDQTADNIMTNPPFNISTKYTLKALQLARKKVLILNKVTFLEGIQRRDKLFSLNKLRTAYIYGKRLQFDPTKKGGGTIAFAWFLFDNEYNGSPTLEWI